MEFIMSVDSVICVIAGAVIGALTGQVAKGFGIYVNIAIGAAGGLIGGLVFDRINVIDVGDYADPIIAGVVGSVIALAIGLGYLRLQRQ